MRVKVVTECNTEKVLAEMLLEGICDDIRECVVHPRYGGIGRALRKFEELVKQVGDPGSDLEVVGLVSDLERGKITEGTVRGVIERVFQGTEPVEVYSGSERRILLYKKLETGRVVFGVLFDPWFEEVFSELSMSFKKLYEKLGSEVKRGRSRRHLERVISDEPVREVINSVRTQLFGA